MTKKEKQHVRRVRVRVRVKVKVRVWYIDWVSMVEQNLLCRGWCLVRDMRDKKRN